MTISPLYVYCRVVIYYNYSWYRHSPLLSTIITSAASSRPIPLQLTWLIFHLQQTWCYVGDRFATYLFILLLYLYFHYKLFQFLLCQDLGLLPYLFNNRYCISWTLFTFNYVLINVLNSKTLFILLLERYFAQSMGAAEKSQMDFHGPCCHFAWPGSTQSCYINNFYSCLC